MDLELPQSDLDAIERLHQRWIRLEMERRGRELLELCAEDVVCMPPGRPPLSGREAVGPILSAQDVKVLDIRIRNLEIRGSAPSITDGTK